MIQSGYMGCPGNGHDLGQDCFIQLRHSLKWVTAGSCLLTVFPAAGAMCLSLKGDLDGATQNPPQLYSPVRRYREVHRKLQYTEMK